MEPYRPYVDELVYQIVKEKRGRDLVLDRQMKARLLVIPTLDIVIGGKRSPLMVGVSQTTASLAKCFSGELRRIAYPERWLNPFFLKYGAVQWVSCDVGAGIFRFAYWD